MKPALFPYLSSFPPTPKTSCAYSCSLSVRIEWIGPWRQRSIYKVFLLFVKSRRVLLKKCICLQIYIGGMCANAIATPIWAINLYILSSWVKTSQKSISRGLHTNKSLLHTPRNVPFPPNLGLSNSDKFSACVYSQRTRELWRIILGQGC